MRRNGAAWPRTAIFAGKPLYRQGFWNVLGRVISGEAYQLGLDAGGYDSTLSNWNAADAIPWYLSDFGIDPDYKGFKQGFQRVPKSLAGFSHKRAAKSGRTRPSAASIGHRGCSYTCTVSRSRRSR